MPSRWIYLAAAIAVVTGLVGVVIGVNLAPDDDTVVTGGDTGGGVSNVGEVVSVSQSFDPFDRPDDDASLGAPPEGPSWETPAGTWGILADQAHLSQPIAGRNLAVVDVGQAESSFQLQVPVVSDGAGLVFRYLDVTNYWAFVAVPAYATWAAVKVVDGREQAVVNTGLSATADGTVVGVRLSGETIDLILDSRVVTTINDPELAGATGIGLTARDATARLDDLRIDQPGDDAETDEEAETEEDTGPGESQPAPDPPDPPAVDGDPPAVDGDDESTSVPDPGEGATSSTQATLGPPAAGGRNRPG